MNDGQGSHRSGFREMDIHDARRRVLSLPPRTGPQEGRCSMYAARSGDYADFRAAVFAAPMPRLRGEMLSAA